MSDTYELTLSIRLPGTLRDGELAELRGCLGLAEALEVEEPHGGPPALLADRGALTPAADGWAMTAHRDVGAGEFDALGGLLCRLAELTGIPGPVVVGQLRSLESTLAGPVVVRRGAVEWPVP
ncbi:hypothetical protein [Kitasatospora sp. MBT63]|uniref:hypothetical protein n=1 Tax=Kitasatospora sp. MBT63 TaxID=1444768 RepID=UPI00068CE3CA|nr:hypothetical protein [Kitasatospora sp. MBT63]